LFRWEGGQCRRYTRQEGLSSDTIRCLHCEPDGALWIGTMDGGLNRFKDNHFITCTTRNGLVDDVINYIADDGRGYYWFTSFQGIFRASKKELNEFAEGARQRVACVAFGKSDGLPALECPGGFQPAGCRASDGQLWFPTIKGLVVVDPASVPTNSVPPVVLVEEVIADGEVLSVTRGDKVKDKVANKGKVSPALLTLRPGYHRLEFRYTGLNFSAPERVRFRHQIAGLDGDWVEAGTQRAAFYSRVPHGDYRFLVTACNQAGIWNETPASLAFEVLPYFWQTWWFNTCLVVLAAAALSGTVFVAARHRWQRKVEGLEVQLSVEKERARIAQDIHDGVGANLTEIAWLAELAEKQAGKPDEVRAQARKISGTARETVQSFDEIVWAVLPQNDTLTSLVEYLGRRVDELFENTNIRYRFVAPSQLPAIVVAAEARHSFYLACKEALHNVVRHSQASEAVVEVNLHDSTLKVRIDDDGHGFDSAKVFSSGNGLRNMRQRFEALGGHFEVHSRPAEGTRVLMTLPLNKRMTASR
jgi:signal transduction histidine kinase